MSETKEVPLAELMASRLGTIEPQTFPEERFDYYSIPAFDAGRPELAFGHSIGSAKQLIQPDDVLLSRIVPHIRRAWIVGKDNGRRIIGSGEWIVLRSSKFHPPYLRHLLVADGFHAEFMRTVEGVGGSLLRARPANVARIEVLLPPLDEQQRIAAILDKAEALQTKRRQALAKLDTLTQSLFLEMFGDASKSRGWKEGSLEDLVDLRTGFPFLSTEYVEDCDGVRLCRGANVLPSRIDWSDLAKLPLKRKQDYNDYLLKEEDILVAMDRPWISEGFKIARVTDADSGALLVQRVARLRAREQTASSFVYELLRGTFFTRHCRPTETTVPHISPTDFRTFRFRVPPALLMDEFAMRAKRINALKVPLQRAEHITAELTSNVRHKAFRGEL